MLFVSVLLACLGLSLGFHSVDPPKQDCVTRPRPYGACTASCGGGQKTRTLEIVQNRIGYGRACPPLTETVPCNEQPCAVDCQVEEGTWTICSASCGQGTQTKLDQILAEGAHGGKPCPSAYQLRSTRPCQNAEGAHGGKPCPSAYQLRSTRPCQNLPACPVPVDCVIGYTEYSQCTRPCGGGIQTRTAYIVSQPRNGGAPCPVDMSVLTSSQPCNVDVRCEEPKDCEYIQADWGQCSVSCGTGVQTRYIFIVSQPENGGLTCPHSSSLSESRPCITGVQCPVPVHCQVEFPAYGQCSRACGGGSQSTTGIITQHPTAGGAACPSYAEMTNTRSCNNAPCVQVTPADCEIEHGEYSECSASCGGGYRTRKGYVKKQAQNGGLNCAQDSTLVERVPCNTQACPAPQDCVVQKAYWSECRANVPCGPATQTRQLTIVKQALNGGLPCPRSLVQTRSCQLPAAQLVQCQPPKPVVNAYGQVVAPRPVPQPRPVIQPRRQVFQSRQPSPALRPALRQVSPPQPAQGQTFTFRGAYQ